MVLFRSAALALSTLPLGMSPALALMAPGAAQAQPQSCNGTLLQLTVQQEGKAAFDRFRFNLGLEAEASTKAAALDQLNARLGALRKVVAPLASGKLTIPAPSTYRSGGGSSGPLREQANTSVAGGGEQGQLQRFDPGGWPPAGGDAARFHGDGGGRHGG